MIHLKKYKKFLLESALTDTYWAKEIGDETIKVTLSDVIDYLDNKDIIEIDPKKLEKLLIEVDRDPKRVDKADLDYPVILAESGGEITHILDGQHRIVKAIKNDLDKIKARILNIDESPEEFKKVFN